jgi:site-specific recombinase XerD
MLLLDLKSQFMAVKSIYSINFFCAAFLVLKSTFRYIIVDSIFSWPRWFFISDSDLPDASIFIAQACRLCRARHNIILLEELTSPDITQFMLHHAHIDSPSRAKLAVTVLRSFLHFLYQWGQISTDLSNFVPTVADWCLSELPKFLKPKEVERLLQGCDQSSPGGQRDYTILLLLARLGLRAGEVVHMELDDIFWETGEFIVRGKSARQDRLPLPQDVGEALATYLCHGRPRCSSRRVFI